MATIANNKTVRNLSFKGPLFVLPHAQDCLGVLMGAIYCKVTMNMITTITVKCEFTGYPKGALK